MEQKKYKVAQAGLGNRGRVHLDGITGNSDRLILSAVCDINKERLDDDSKVHPCNVEAAYHGYEILEALCVSALDNKPVYLPVNADQMPDIIKRMKEELI